MDRRAVHLHEDLMAGDIPDEVDAVRPAIVTSHVVLPVIGLREAGPPGNLEQAGLEVALAGRGARAASPEEAAEGGRPPASLASQAFHRPAQLGLRHQAAVEHRLGGPLDDVIVGDGTQVGERPDRVGEPHAGNGPEVARVDRRGAAHSGHRGGSEGHELQVGGLAGVEGRHLVEPAGQAVRRHCASAPELNFRHRGPPRRRGWVGDDTPGVTLELVGPDEIGDAALADRRLQLGRAGRPVEEEGGDLPREGGHADEYAQWGVTSPRRGHSSEWSPGKGLAGR
jgi:hypothetical protein